MAFRITAFILVNIGSISFDILNNKFQKTMIHYWISTCNRINLDYVTPNSFLELLYFAFKYVDSFVLPLKYLFIYSKVIYSWVDKIIYRILINHFGNLKKSFHWYLNNKFRKKCRFWHFRFRKKCRFIIKCKPVIV